MEAAVLVPEWQYLVNVATSVESRGALTTSMPSSSDALGVDAPLNGDRRHAPAAGSGVRDHGQMLASWDPRIGCDTEAGRMEERGFEV